MQFVRPGPPRASSAEMVDSIASFTKSLLRFLGPLLASMFGAACQLLVTNLCHCTGGFPTPFAWIVLPGGGRRRCSKMGGDNDDT